MIVPIIFIALAIAFPILKIILDIKSEIMLLKESGIHETLNMTITSEDIEQIVNLVLEKLKEQQQ